MSTQMQEPSKEIFVEAWSELNNKPHEPMSSTQAAVAVEMVTDADGEELFREAIDMGVLESRGSGYTIAGAEPPSKEEDADLEETESRTEPEEMERSELEREVKELRTDLDEMSGRMNALHAGLNEMRKIVVGTTDVSTVVDADNMTDVWTRLDQMSESVEEHEDKLHMFSKGGGKKKSPDERAITIRAVLYQKSQAGSSDVSKMTRDECDTALGGGMTRYKLIEAMRRAANGDNGDINGSSDLECLDGVEVLIGSGRDEQSKIRMDLEEATAAQLRRIPTTEQEGNGGS